MSNKLPAWTGFQDKTLWEWLQLVIIPLTLLAASVLLNNAQDQRQQRLEDDRANANALQAYYDKMADLILNYDLRDDEEREEALSIAQARTIATLSALDGERKGLLVRFLYESHLIGYFDESFIGQEPIISLIEADLRGADLSRANLYGTYLSVADLSDANLRDAILSQAYLNAVNLSDANLSGAHLKVANLNGADLRGADLRGARLDEASLNQADLRGADLRNAVLIDADLRGAKLRNTNLRGAVYADNRTQWPDGFDPLSAGADNVASDFYP